MPHKPYTVWAPFYDLVVRRFLQDLRAEAVAQLELRPGRSLLVLGIGTGLDLALLPKGVDVTGLDLSEAMLARARRRARLLGVEARLEIADAQSPPFADGSFDAVYLPLIVAVADDGAAVVAQALRLVKPGRRVVVMDKFMPRGCRPNLLWRLAEAVLGRLATHIDRRWEDIAAAVSARRAFTPVADIPGPLRGYFRVIVLERPLGPTPA